MPSSEEDRLRAIQQHLLTAIEVTEGAVRDTLVQILPDLRAVGEACERTDELINQWVERLVELEEEKARWMAEKAHLLKRLSWLERFGKESVRAAAVTPDPR